MNTADRVPILNFLSDDVVADPPATRKKEGLLPLMDMTKVGELEGSIEEGVDRFHRRILVSLDPPRKDTPVSRAGQVTESVCPM